MPQKLKISNKALSLILHLNGGAVVSLAHTQKPDTDILNFSFSKKQMAQIGNTGAPFRGHFICCPYWGSAGNNQPWHGPFAAGKWKKQTATKNSAHIYATYKDFGLSFRKEIHLHQSLPIYRVNEHIENILNTPVVYNLVQHPTLQTPFLNDETIIQSNAAKGLLQDDLVAGHLHQASNWPFIKKGKKKIDLGKSAGQQSVVATFLMPQQEQLGWVTAYSPVHELLFGYCWNIENYPWFNIWKQVENDKAIYTGLEFGTTGIHLNLFDTIHVYPKSFGINNYHLLAPLSQHTKSYWSFLLPFKRSHEGVKNINLSKTGKLLQIQPLRGKAISFDMTF